jgi:glycosyltransferase involved in cell wall biosynthesis
MDIIITSPSLNRNQNISGISSVTEFIISRNTVNKYIHFELGKKDSDNRNLIWFLRILRAYVKWFYIMFAQRDFLIHFNFALSKPSIIRDSPLIMLARLFRRRMIIHLHGGEYLMHKQMPTWMKHIIKYDLSDSNPKIVLSAIEEEVLKYEFQCNKVYVLPNCIELEEATRFNRTYSNVEKLKLLFIGRITIDKGIDTIYQACERLKQKRIKFNFVMAGKGSEEKVYAQKFDELLGEDFNYCGVVSGSQKAKLLQTCDVFILPSLFEGLPIALLESMSFGLVPVTTNVGSIKHVIVNEINGIIVNKQASEEIVSAIEKLSDDREYMMKLSKNARQYIFDNYKPDAYIARLNEIYEYE